MFASKLIAIVAISAYTFLVSEACTCVAPDSLPKNVGCADEFLAVVTITGTDPNREHQVINGLQETAFHFSVIEDYTPMLATPKHLTEFSTIWSNSPMGMCGMSFQVDSTYLILSYFSGGRAQANICTTRAKYLDKVPTHEEAKTMLAQMYKEHC